MIVLRLLGGLLLAAALMLLPTSAFAGPYPGDGEEMVVTETNPDPGEPFEVIVDAGPDSDEATLTITSDDADDSDIEIAGTQSLTKATNAAGIARFTVTLYEEGVYTMISYDENGNVIERTQIVVGDGEPGADGGAGGGADGGAGAGDSGAGIGLGDTGASSTSVLLGSAGVLLLLGGGAALMYSRRRKTQLA